MSDNENAPLTEYVDVAERDFDEWWRHSFGAIGGTPETKKFCFAAWSAALELAARRTLAMRQGASAT